MNVYECLENGAINELINFSFDEVKRVFNRCAYYVPEICENQFVNEATAVKTWYQGELKKIEKYKQEEYRDLLSLGEDIPEYDTPEYNITIPKPFRKHIFKLYCYIFLFQIISNLFFIISIPCFDIAI
ncbi:MAG: hypothetical protein J6L85_01085 [Clostridia bacterium]|nr:hypothetical protein [Clostridia bacterium]